MRAKVYKGTAMRFIAFAGIFTFVFLLVCAYALHVLLEASNSPKPRGVNTSVMNGPFDGQRAYADVEAMAAFGPRPPDSQAIAHTRRFIRKALRGAGLSVRTVETETDTAAGPVETITLYGVVEGTAPEVLVLCTHYDAPANEDYGPPEGINDGAASTAWLMEMARILGPEREGRSVWLCFFDGRFPIEEWSAEDGLFGSRAFVASLRDRDELGDIQAVIDVDKIGDCHLVLPRDIGAPAWLAEAIAQAAVDQGSGHIFIRQGGTFDADHVSFRKAGVPAMGLVSFTAMGSDDSLDSVCPESLQAVGNIIYHALVNLDRYLDGEGTPS